MEYVADDTQLEVQPLGAAVRAYIRHCEINQRLAKGTVNGYRCVLDVLVEVCGSDLPTHTLNSQHITWTMAKAAKGDTPAEAIARTARNGKAQPRAPRNPNSLNINVSVYKTFVRYCQGQRWLSPYRDPTMGLRATKTAVVRQSWVKWTVPFADRTLLLEMAGKIHPRDRFVAAMGLYGGRRTSDIRGMRIKDIDLDAETFTFTNEKTGGVRKELPILWPAFMSEVRRWLAWYAGQHGELDPNWYLIPRRLVSSEYFVKEGRPSMDPSWPVMPTDPTHDSGEHVKRSLELIGAPVERGGFGMHVLRHSCAVWLLDDQRWDIYDVATWLDHTDVEITKGVYLRGANDIKRLRDKYESPSPEGGEVVPLSEGVRRKAERMAYAG